MNAKLVNTRLTYSLAACYRHIEDRVFSRRQRKTRILFALSDVLLVTLAFVVAYRTRASVELLNREFFLSPSVQVLIAAIGGMSWVLAGRWMAVGPSGTDISRDDGRTWVPVAGPGFHTFSAAGRVGFGAGERGLIGRLQ